jgi:general secretion pathway protein G
MTKSEFRNNDEFRMTNDETALVAALSTFGIRHSTLIRHSDFVIRNCGIGQARACLCRENGMKATSLTRRGFTLLELLLVVIIIGILAAAVIPNLAGRSEQARIAAAKQDIGAIGLALDMFNEDIGSYPTTQQGLDALVNAPAGATGWKGPYIKSGVVPVDPWGNPYQYTFPGPNSPTMYVLSSNGPDGQANTADDISSQQAPKK